MISKISFIALFAAPLLALADNACIDKCSNKLSRKGDSCFAEMCKRKCEAAAKGNPKELLKFSPDGQTMYITGPIQMGTDFDFNLDEGIDVPEKMRNANRARSEKVKFVVLNSPGGDLSVAQKFMNWIEKKGDGIKVIVPHGAICGSACADIFRCAKNRVADETALIMFHPASVDGPLTPAAIQKMKRENENSEKTSCAKSAAETQGGKMITQNLRQGKESCYRAKDLGGSMGFLETEGPSSFGPKRQSQGGVSRRR